MLTLKQVASLRQYLSWYISGQGSVLNVYGRRVEGNGPRGLGLARDEQPSVEKWKCLSDLSHDLKSEIESKSRRSRTRLNEEREKFRL